MTHDVSLFNHCLGSDGSHFNQPDDGYVGTSTSFDFCKGWIEDELRQTGVIYEIATYGNLVDCQMTLQQYNNIAAEAELAALGSIPWEQIIGWYDQFTMIKGEIRDAVYTKNSQYNKAKYDNQEDAGAQYHLAGFPRNHEAWKKLPWSKFAKCTNKTIIPKPSRRAVNNSARVRTSQSKEPKITTPKTPTSKTPTPKAPTPKISTPQTCTAAQKKAGTCKDETKGTCSPIKTNKEFYNEYLRLLKAGKAPKSDAPRIRGSKKKTGKTTPGA